VDSLDGLRGLAILIVFLSHTANNHVPLISFVDFTGVGKSGVYLFFTLSAFLLTSSFVMLAHKAFSLRALANYFLRRLLRIYPLLILLLLLALGTTHFARNLRAWELQALPFPLTPAELLQSLLLLVGKGDTWSILVEFRFYFLLPILAVFFILLRNRIVLSALFTAALILLCLWIWPGSSAVNNDINLGYYLPVFLIGSFLAVLHHYWNHSSGWGRSRWLGWLVEILGVVGAIGLIAMIPSVAGRVFGNPISLLALHNQFLLFGLFCGLMLFACLNGRGLIRRVFEFRPLRYLGFISYSVYLIHPVVLRLFLHWKPDLPLAGWWILAATLAISFLSFSFIEKPFSKIRLASSAENEPPLGIPDRTPQ